MPSNRIKGKLALLVAMLILGGTAAQAASDGQLVPPYESSSGQGVYRASVTGDMASAAQGTSTSWATVVAAHQTDAPVASVTYTVRFRLDKSQTVIYDSAPGAPYYDFGPYAGLFLQVTGQHSACGTCRGTSQVAITNRGPQDIALTVTVANQAGGKVPAGTIRISVDLLASAYTNGITPTPGNGWIQCGPGVPGFCRICPFNEECGGSLETNVETAWAFAAGTLTSIEYDIQSAVPNQLPTARFTVSCVKTDCQFAGSSSSDPDGQITSYAWDFGDSTSAQGSSVQHFYPEVSASYTATLTVTDNRGGADSESRVVRCTRKGNKPITCS